MVLVADHEIDVAVVELESDAVPAEERKLVE